MPHHLRLVPAATPLPPIPLRSDAAELRAVVIAARHRVSVHHARVLDELQVSPARRG